MRRPVLALLAVCAVIEGAARLAPEPPRILPDYSPLFVKFASDLRKPFFKEEGGMMVPARSVDVFRGTAFSRRKPAGRFRVVCVGESTVALGDFTRELAAYLAKALPGIDAEVINAGQGFINPPNVLKVFREVVDYEPDAVVVYMGHNFRHVMPDVGPRTLRAAAWADHSAALRWAVRGARAVLGRRLPPPGDAADRERFERSLSAMAALAKARSLPLVVCTAASNLVLPPHFSPDALADEASRARFGAALLELELGRAEKAAALFAPLAAREPGVALLHYLRGSAEARARRRESALESLSLARDLDYDDRAPAALNRAVRTLSRDESLYRVADAEAEFAAAARDGVPGFDLFIDQCHPRKREYRLIARSVTRALARTGLYPGRWRRLAPDQEPAEGESRAEILQSLLNTGFIASLNATYYGERAFSEIPTRYFEEALRLEPEKALARIEDPSAVVVLQEVLSPTELGPSLRERTWAFGLVHAAAALRRLGRPEPAGALIRLALPKLDGRLLAQARLQQAVLSDGGERARSLDAARAAWPGIDAEPLYLALHARR